MNSGGDFFSGKISLKKYLTGLSLLSRISAWLIFTVFAPLLTLCLGARLIFGKINYTQIVLNCSLENLPYWPKSYLLWAGLFLVIFIALSVLYGWLLFRGKPWRKGIRERGSLSRFLILSGLNILCLGGMVAGSLWLIVFEFAFPLFKVNRLEFSDCLQKQYVPVFRDEIRFPAKKMNLIYLVSESMENAWSRPEFYERNLIPELTDYAARYDSFGGFRSVLGTWGTTMALFSGQMGLPRFSDRLNWRNEEKKKQPYNFYHCPSLFQILQKNGYQTAYLLGGDINYAGTNTIYDRVPDIHILSQKNLEKDPEYVKLKKKSKWGVNDAVLFRYVQKEITELHQSGKPFAVQISTIDTHFPGPFFDEKAEHIFGDYRDVYRNQSRMIGNFVEWLKQQPFFADTLVVICGDHLAWRFYPTDKAILTKLPGFERTVYNCIMNSAVKKQTLPETPENRTWAAFDLMPTILEAMGGTWNGHRLGVGTSLYSGEKTWLEKVGLKTYDQEMLKFSRLYLRLK